MGGLGGLVEAESTNAALSWALVAVLCVAMVVDLATSQWLWAGLTGAILAVAVAPSVITGDRSAVVSWEALALSTLPVAARAVGRFADPLTYVSVATLALLVAVQLVTFSETEMPPWFAVAFVVLTTMAVAAVWAVVQFHADAVLGTEFVSERRELMWDLLGATAAGLGAGLVFEFYFRRRPTDGLAALERETG